MIELWGGGVSFRLKVLGYEFEGDSSQYDSEWLVIEISVDGVKGSWQSSGPFLRTVELKDFLGWLKNVRSHNENAELHFLEGELSFGFVPPSSLRVYLDFYFHPKCASYDYAEDEAFVLEFDTQDEGWSSLVSCVERMIEDIGLL
ncbi:WapI family immunity protein [Metapseudomonas otitidis]|uniref:WapI family immunity protein n=1 Tax=Metapseudomonas otitidis TaxID=319939 RepID=UPI0013F5F4AC|nr:hypothetical protein [Pseudomonas otitidis]